MHVENAENAEKAEKAEKSDLGVGVRGFLWRKQKKQKKQTPPPLCKFVPQKSVMYCFAKIALKLDKRGKNYKK